MNAKLYYIGEMAWWQLTNEQREYVSARIKALVYEKHKGNRESVLGLVRAAIASGKVPIVLIWRLYDEVRYEWAEAV